MAQEVATLRGQLHTLRLRRDDLCLVNFLDGMSDFLQEPPAKLTPVAVARYLGLRLDCIHVEHWASLPGSEALPPVPDAMEETINDIVLDHIRVVYREPDMAAFKGYLDFLAMAMVTNENVAVPIPGVTKKGRITINRGRKSP